MENIDDLERAINRKQGRFDKLAQEAQARNDRKLRLQEEQSYQHDRIEWWDQRAEQLEQEAQKAREKAQKAAQREQDAIRVLGDVDWEKDAQERTERFEQLEHLRRLFRDIKDFQEREDSTEDRIEQKIYRDQKEKLIKEFKSVKGTGV